MKSKAEELEEAFSKLWEIELEYAKKQREYIWGKLRKLSGYKERPRGKDAIFEILYAKVPPRVITNKRLPRGKVYAFDTRDFEIKRKEDPWSKM